MKNLLSGLQIISIAAITILVSSFSFAQSKLDVKPEKWHVISENELGKIEYRIMICDNAQNGMNAEDVQLKLTNKSNKEISITYAWGLQYDNYSQNLDGSMPEFQYTKTLAPGKSLAAQCFENVSGMSSRVRLLDIKSSELQDFEILNISIR